MYSLFLPFSVSLFNGASRYAISTLALMKSAESIKHAGIAPRNIPANIIMPANNPHGQSAMKYCLSSPAFTFVWAAVCHCSMFLCDTVSLYMVLIIASIVLSAEYGSTASCITPLSSAGRDSSIAPRTSSSSNLAVTNLFISPISSHTAPRQSANSASAA